MAAHKMNDLPGNQAAYYLKHTATTIDKSLPITFSPVYVDDNVMYCNLNNRVVMNYPLLMNSDYINRSGESSNDLPDSGITAILNKCTVGKEFILERRAFQRPSEGIKWLNAILGIDVYEKIAIA